MILKHVALVCGSEEKADKFYGGFLNLKKSPPKKLPAALSKRLFNIGKSIQIVNYMDEYSHFEIFIHETRGHATDKIAHVCIEVPDINKFLEKGRALKLAVLQVPNGSKTITFIRDYDGNLFEIKSSTPSDA